LRQATDLRVVLRVVRTVLRCFYRQLRAKAGVFVEALIAGGILLVCCVTWLVTAQHSTTDAPYIATGGRLRHVGATSVHRSLADIRYILVDHLDPGNTLQARRRCARCGSAST
jgi:hypothetical protein